MILPKSIAYILAAIGLGLTTLPAILVFTGAISQDLNKTLMAVGMVCWFIAAFRIMKRNS